MLLYGSDYHVLAYEAQKQARKSSAEEVLQPRFATAQFRSPRAAARAWKRYKLRAIPHNARRTHLAIDPGSARWRTDSAARPGSTEACVRPRETSCSSSAAACTSSRARGSR